MNWYKRYKLSSISGGEWWIIDGVSLFADGDVGDQNHESYVINHVRSQYAYPAFDNGEYVDWDGFKIELARENFQRRLNEASSENKLKLQERWSMYNGDDPFFYGPELERLGMTREEMLIADGNTSQVDIRGYGMKKLGWKRVKGNNVQTQTLTSSDLKDIANGLWDAYNEDCEKELFTIEVNSTRNLYENVPYDIICSDSPIKLRPYGTRY